MASASTLPQTPSQTIGPFFAYGLTPSQYRYPLASLVGNAISGEGEAIILRGQVLDGDGNSVDDAMLEIWQPDCRGRFDNPDFFGFARSGTGAADDNEFVFHSVRPGATVEGAAPYISVVVFMRGLLLHCHTRIYFSDDAPLLQSDPVFSQLPEPRRHTLLAERSEQEGEVCYRFDIHMQGASETLFFDI